jgi:hypothetical protein
MNLKNLIALIPAFLWGIEYSLLQQLDVLHPAVVGFIYGVGTTFVNGIIIFSLHLDAQLRSMNSKIVIYLISYVILGIGASYIFLWGSTVIDKKSTAIYNAIGSIYPWFVTIICYIFFDQRTYNWYYVIPGMFLTITGVVLLTLSKT